MNLHLWINALAAVVVVVSYSRALSVVEPVCRVETHAEIAIMVDESGSINNDEYQLEVDFVRDVVNDVLTDNNGNTARFSIIHWAAKARVGFSVSDQKSKKDILDYIENMRSRTPEVRKADVGETTHAAKAIIEMRQMFVKARTKKGRPFIGILITDGEIHQLEHAVQKSKEAQNGKREITMITIGVEQTNPDFITALKRLASPTAEDGTKFWYNVKGFKELSPLLRKKVQKSICTPPPTDKICFTKISAEIALMVDESPSISQDEYLLEIDFIEKLVTDLLNEENEMTTRFSVIHWANTAKLGFSVANQTKKSDILDYIKSMRQRTAAIRKQEVGGSTHADNPILEMRRMFASARTRLGRPFIGILITDGHIHDLEKAAARSRSAQNGKRNITMISIGVQKTANDAAFLDGLKQIASPDTPDGQKHWFMVNQFDKLAPLIDPVEETICHVEPPKRICKKKLAAEIAIMVDESPSIDDNEYQLELNFVERIVTDLLNEEVENSVRFSIIHWSRIAKTGFELTDQNEKRDVLDFIDKMRNRTWALRGKEVGDSTHAATAIIEMRRMFVRARTRLRQPFIGILITDGEIHGLHHAIEKSKQAQEGKRKITMMTIGVEQHRNNPAFTEALQQIASPSVNGSKFWFHVNDFEDMIPQLLDRVEQETCKVVPPPALCKRTLRAEIALLVDESPSIDNDEYQLQLNFIRTIVNDLLREEKDLTTRFGIIQWARHAKTGFTLSQQTRKNDTLEYIDQMRKRTPAIRLAELGDSTLAKNPIVNMRRMFVDEKTKADRPFIGILLTDGEIFDIDVAEAKSLEAQTGKRNITMITIGIEQKRKDPNFVKALQRIASPDAENGQKHWFTVENFSDLLPDLRRKVENIICSAPCVSSKCPPVPVIPDD